MVQQPAGFWIRFGAMVLDGLLLGLVGFILAAIVGLAEIPQLILDTTVQVAYMVIVPVLWVGYTIGKKICNVRVVKLDGTNVGFGTMILREVVGLFVYGITLGIGIIVSALMVGLRKDKRSLHDLIANTYVTYQKPEEEENPYQTQQ